MRFTLLALLALLPGSAAGQAAFSAAARYSAEHAGDAVLIFRHDSLVLEEYQNGYDGTAPHQLASGTKAFTCVLAGLAQGDGLLTLDEPVYRTLTEFAADSALRRLTIRQLLNLTSGLEVDASGRLAVQAGPGQRFAYSGTSFALFGMLLSRKLNGEDLVAYLTRRVFMPIGITVGSWQRDGSGQPGLASGAALTARDWGALGLLLLHRGTWKGKSLVPRMALEECGKGSAANPGYGLGLWLNAARPSKAAPAGVERAGATDHMLDARELPLDLWMAAGAGGQRLYILPSQGMVAVRFGHNTGPDYRDEVFLRLLLGR